MIEIENIKTLKRQKSKRIFVFVSILALLLEFIALWFIDQKDLSSGSIHFQILKEVLLNLSATTLTGIILVLIIVYLLPYERQENDVEVLDPEKTKREHFATLGQSVFWYHNGHLGRWVRTQAMPSLSKKSTDKGIPVEVKLIILNPNDTKVCDEYLRYRKGIYLEDKSNVDSVEDVKAELIATIVCGQLYHQDPSGLRINIFINSQLSLVREDINSQAVFRTLINPRCNCLVFYNRNTENHSSQFYNTANSDFNFVSGFCEKISMDNKIDIRNKRDLTLDKLRIFLNSNKLAVGASDDFLNDILARVLSDYNPYK